jgi:dihydroneopterin aldolase
MKILLKDIELYGFHGVHELEKKVGIAFKVDAIIEFNEKDYISDLTDTIDYEIVFSIIKSEFVIKESLLECLAIRIINSIKAKFPFISAISLSIIKKGAYIEGLNGNVGVELTRNFL